MHSPLSRYYQASTSEMYGNSNGGMQDENTTFKPRSPYGVSKLYAYWMTINFRESYSIHASNGILFNHESPLRGLEFVTRKVTNGIAKIKLGLQDKITLGNLDSKRDWGYAGDYVEAMWLMLQQKTPDDYVIATGKTHSVREFLLESLKAAGLEPDEEKYYESDPQMIRPAEVDLLIGNSTKAKEKLGWTPRIDFQQLVTLMVSNDLDLESRN
jgi:GDPmannose 4,6-dehydratase